MKNKKPFTSAKSLKGAMKQIKKAPSNSISAESLNKLQEEARNGDLNKAQLQVAELLKTNPRHSELMLISALIQFSLGNATVGLDIVKRAIPLSTPDAIMNLSSDLIIAEKNLEANEVIALALEKHPNHCGLLNNAGIAFKRAGRLNEALSFFEKALTIDKNYQLALNNLGNTYMQQNNPGRALSCFDMLVDLNPRHAEYLRLQASAHIRMNKHKEATEALHQALSYEPRNTAAIADLSAAYYNRQIYDKALSAISKGLEISPNDQRLLQIEALVLQKVPTFNA